MSEPTRPKAPDHLSVEAVTEWHRVCDELADAGRLDVTDRALLVLYCEAWAVYQDMMKHVVEFGAVVKWANGTAGQSPQFKTSRELAFQLRMMLADLGLTPLTRSKVKSPDKEPADLSF